MSALAPRAPAQPIELANEPDFDLGAMRVKPAELAVVTNGDRRALQPKVMQVLVSLAHARPAVVSRDRLVEMCWAGRTVGDDALNRCILALRHLAQEFNPQPFHIETVPRIGHRLVSDGETFAAVTVSRIRQRRRIAVAAAAVLLILAAGYFVWLQRQEAAAPASIAVLPFRNLDEGTPYFAQGVGEEILGQLAREPAFRVAGSVVSPPPHGSDVREVAGRLGVDYVVEGTVQQQQDQVRVTARLVRGTDGTAVWSNSYDGALDDVFVMQRQIGSAIAAALSRRLVRAPALSEAMVTDGKAYNLYLTARGLIRTRARIRGPIAADLLRDALQIDPGFAPAWASLADATLLAGALGDHDNFAASVAEAQRYARRALDLAPNLAEAHRSLGALHGFGTPDAVTHLRRAAQLAPNNPDNMIGLGATLGATGHFDKEVAAYRRASDLDPLWFRPLGAHVIALAELGDRAQAEAIVRRRLPAGGIEQQILLAKTASIAGDVSEAVRLWSLVAASRSPRWSETARRTRDATAFAVGLRTGPLTIVSSPLDQRHLWRIWMAEAPSGEVWRRRNRDPIAAAVHRDDNHVAAKHMLNAGRAHELAAAYDGPGGMVGIGRGRPLRVDQISEAPVAALALRNAGRPAEAERLVANARNMLDALRRRGPLPVWLEADAAAMAAVAGRKDESVALLDRAMRRGWTHGGPTDLMSIADEPAFRLLRGHPGFERLRARLADHFARERAETLRVLGQDAAAAPQIHRKFARSSI